MGYSKKKGRPGRLPCWDYSAVGCYFITFCTKDRRCILSQVVGRDDFGAPSVELTSYGAYLLHLLNSLPNAYPNVKLHHSVIMPNHVHLLLSIEPHALSAPGSSRSTQLVPRMIAALKRFTNQFAGFNLWQSTYHDHIIRSEADYLRIWDYIDTNPAKWREDCYYCQAEGGDLIVKHTYLFRPGRWRAEGTYYDEADRALPLTGWSEVLRTQQQWTLDGALEVQLPTPLRFTNRYQLRETNFPQTLAWESYNPALGTLTGTFEVVGPNLLSQYRSSDGVYSGFEILTFQADGSYQNTGLSLKSGRRMSAWTALLRAE